MTSTIDLHLQGSMDQLRVAWQAGEALLELVPFEEDPEGNRYNVLLAVQEMITNVLRHSYRGDDRLPLQVTFRAETDGFEVVLRDRGPRFDPTTHTAVARDGDGVPKEGGGYGIVIMRTVMDEASYRYEDGTNVLRMFKSARRPVLAERDA